MTDRKAEEKRGRAKKKVLDPIIKASEFSRAASAKFMADVASSLVWPDFKDKIDKLQQFEDMKMLAMYDMWGEVDIVELEERGIPIDRLIKLRSHSSYPEIRRAMDLAVEELGKSKTVEEWVEHSGPEAFKMLAQQMRVGEPHQAMRAAKEFTDRAFPKPTRATGDGGRTFNIPESMIHLLTDALRQGRLLTEGNPEKDVTPAGDADPEVH